MSARTITPVFAVLATTGLASAAWCAESDTDTRVRGLLLGSVIGDALGGPVEFASGEATAEVLPGYRERPEKVLHEGDLRRLADRLPLLPYGRWRPEAEPYGQWTAEAPAGTVTDDTRHKIVLIDALRRSPVLDRRALAQAYLDFAERPEIGRTADWDTLCERSFRDFRYAARWELGERDAALALPPSRMWGGLGTCCGQMTLPPLAALYPGEPRAAYQAAYDLAFFDNGEAKDINAAIVGGLAFALGQHIPADNPASRQAAWRAMVDAMKRTDPLRYEQIEFVDRAFSRTVDRALELAVQAEGSPGRLYELIEEACPRDHAWEAKFLLMETVAIAEFAAGEPLAAIHLALDFGQDTDSAAQLLGAWYGALYGPELLPGEWRRKVADRLAGDYRERLDDWLRVLARARKARAAGPTSNAAS